MSGPCSCHTRYALTAHGTSRGWQRLEECAVTLLTKLSVDRDRIAERSGLERKLRIVPLILNLRGGILEIPTESLGEILIVIDATHGRPDDCEGHDGWECR